MVTTDSGPAVPSPVGSGTAPARPMSRIMWAPEVRGIASGLGLMMAFPPVGWPWLAWVALVPLLSLAREPRGSWRLYVASWLGGLCFWLPSMSWLRELHPSAWIAWLALGLYLSIYWPLALAFTRLLARTFRVPLVLAAPAAWLACDYIQAFALSGLPWYYLAHSQFRVLPLIQIADLFGAWGVTAVLVASNVTMLDLIGLARLRGRSFALDSPRPWVSPSAVALILAATLTYGSVRLSTSRFTPGPTVVLLQSNLQQASKTGLEPAQIVAIYRDLIRRGIEGSAAPNPRGELIIWPETSYPYGFVRIAPEMTPEAAARAARDIFPRATLAGVLQLKRETTDELLKIARGTGRAMVVGALLFNLAPTGGKRANGAILLDPTFDNIQIYTKIHLVPFGEYVPLLDVLPWIRRLAPYDEDRPLPQLVSGVIPKWFDYKGIRYAPVICFEDTVPHLVRRFFTEVSDGRTPDVILNISNDGWFNGTAEHDLHLASSVFRAVEQRAPLVRAANMGYSIVADGDGRLREILAKKTAGAIRAEVPLDPRSSLYRQWGDVLPQGCLALVLAALVKGLASQLRFKPEKPPTTLTP